MGKGFNGIRGIPEKYAEYPINILYKVCKYKYGKRTYDFIINKNIRERMILVIDQLDNDSRDIIEMRFKDKYQLLDIGNKYTLTDAGILYKINRCIKFISDNYIDYIIYDNNNIMNIPEHIKLSRIGLDRNTIAILYHEKIYSIDDLVKRYNTLSLIEKNRNRLMEINNIGESTYTYIIDQLKSLGFIDNIIPWKESNFNKNELSRKYNKLYGGM